MTNKGERSYPHWDRIVTTIFRVPTPTCTKDMSLPTFRHFMALLQAAWRYNLDATLSLGRVLLVSCMQLRTPEGKA